MRVKNLDYVILSPENSTLTSDGLSLYNKAFHFWFNFWKKFWTQPSDNNSLGPQLAETFYRQTKIHGLMHLDEFVGMVLQTRYDLTLNVTKHLPYFSHYPVSLFEYLERQKITSLVTHEFLSVSPEWRKSSCGFSLGPLLMSLGAKSMQEMGGQASIAIARKDIGVSEMCCKLGWHKVQEDVLYKGYACDIICLRTGDQLISKDLSLIMEHLLFRHKKIPTFDTQASDLENKDREIGSPREAA